MLHIEDVTKTFIRSGEEVQALANLSLSVGKGEFVAIVGPSGSGKSSLLFAMGGLAKPSSGSVRLDGADVYELTARGRAALRLGRIGFVFQTFNLVPYLTCLENVALPAMLAGRSRREARAAASELLERLGLSARLKHEPGQLSVGERQRVAIGRALVNGPALLLADEPTGNLDLPSALNVMELFREIHASGQAIVMVTHDPRMAATAGRVVRLAAGQVETGGNPSLDQKAS